MRAIKRVPLSVDTMDFLWKRRLRVVAAGEKAAHSSEREDAQARKKAQYAEAQRLWRGSYKGNKAFDEVLMVLREDMAPGHGYCMYCEYSHGSTIDHFWPMEKDPTRAFAWDNYLWSCSVCNSVFKGTQFPLDKRGLPLLVNPTRDDPREHLQFTPHDGKLVGCTPKGEKTIQILGFDQRGDLDRTRASAFRMAQRLIVDYGDACAKDDSARAREAQRDLCCQPHASVLSALIEILESPGGALFIDERCAAVLAAYPEIRSWV
jgi:uncharacterized protein (TIGR02646 family)